MGNAKTRGEKIESESEFLDKVDFIQFSTLEPFGEIKIYRFRQAPYEHVLKYSRCFTLEDPSYSEYVRTLSAIHDCLNEKNLAKVHWIGAEESISLITVDFGVCVKSITATSYWGFYSIRLRELISKRRKSDVRFTSKEIFYVAKSLLQLSSSLAQRGLSYGGYRCEEVLLSAEGYIKMYLLHLWEENQHHHYYQAANDRGNLYHYLPLPPEYLTMMQEGRGGVSLEAQSEDPFFIGMILLEMMTDGDTRSYYSKHQDGYAFHHNKVWKDLTILKYIYSQQLIQFITKLLEADPEKRFTIQTGLSYLKSKEESIQIGGALRMFEDDEHQIYPKVSYRTSIDPKSILHSVSPELLGEKLTIQPIKSVSKKPNKKHSCGVSLTTSKHSSSTKSKSWFSKVGRSNSVIRNPGVKNTTIHL